VDGWVALLAALGGLVLGIGIGLVLGRSREQRIRRRLDRLESRLRTSIIPVLEGRAHSLGLPRNSRATDGEDPVDVAVNLSSSIQRLEGDASLPFSDTLELSRKELEGKSR